MTSAPRRFGASPIARLAVLVTVLAIGVLGVLLAVQVWRSATDGVDRLLSGTLAAVVGFLLVASAVDVARNRGRSREVLLDDELLVQLLGERLGSDRVDVLP